MPKGPKCHSNGAAALSPWQEGAGDGVLHNEGRRRGAEGAAGRKRMEGRFEGGEAKINFDIDFGSRRAGWWRLREDQAKKRIEILQPTPTF